MGQHRYTHTHIPGLCWDEDPKRGQPSPISRHMSRRWRRRRRHLRSRRGNLRICLEQLLPEALLPYARPLDHDDACSCIIYFVHTSYIHTRAQRQYVRQHHMIRTWIRQICIIPAGLEGIRRPEKKKGCGTEGTASMYTWYERYSVATHTTQAGNLRTNGGYHIITRSYIYSNIYVSFRMIYIISYI